MDPARRKRRRTRRIVAIAGFLLFSVGLAWFFELQATTTVIVVRHADTVPGQAQLSTQGRRRAEELARVLGNVDVVSGVDVIFATEFKPTVETAQPLADLLEMPVQTVIGKETRALVDRMLRDYKGKIILVVTQPPYIPKIVSRMHGSKKLKLLDEREFDKLVIVSVPWFGKVKTLQLHYGEPYVAEVPNGPLPEPGN